GKVDGKVKKTASVGQEMYAHKLLQQIARALTQTQQAIRQAGNEDPKAFLSTAETHIDYIFGCIEQLKGELQLNHKMVQGGTKQQIEQLNYDVLQAAQTVQLIQNQIQQTK